MAGHCRYDWLLDIVQEQELSYALRALVAVFNRHVAVHENQIIVAKFHFVFFDILNNQFKCLLAIEGSIRKHLDILEANWKLQDCFKSHYVIWLVINDQNFPVGVDLISMSGIVTV